MAGTALSCHHRDSSKGKLSVAGLYWTRDPLSCSISPGFVPNIMLSLLLQVPTEASA